MIRILFPLKLLQIKLLQSFYFINIILLSSLTICFSSCASTAGENRLYANLTDNSKYILLPPEGIEQALDTAQYVSVSYNDQEYFFNAWVKADETGINMTLFNEFGAGMGDLSYRYGFINFTSPVFPTTVKPEYIVADFQLCFYDPILLKGALKKCGLSFETIGANRRVLKGKDLIIEIEKTGSIVKLKNNLRGYAYTLEGGF